MVLFSFSIPSMIPLILSGQKAQTTRIPRKLRANGAKPYNVGEKVQLYYRSRQAKSCSNCISLSTCAFVSSPAIVDMKKFKCPIHSNFFGESVITTIIHYWDIPYEEETGFEYWMPCFDRLDCGERESWAIADGFQGFDEADDFFSMQYGDNWWKKDWDCILWDGNKIARRVA